MKMQMEITTWTTERRIRVLVLDEIRSFVGFIRSTFTHMTASALYVTSMTEDYGVKRCTTYDS